MSVKASFNLLTICQPSIPTYIQYVSIELRTLRSFTHCECETGLIGTLEDETDLTELRLLTYLLTFYQLLFVCCCVYSCMFVCYAGSENKSPTQ